MYLERFAGGFMKLTKSTALKGALLMVLAANVSWEKIEFSSIQLASGGSETTTSSGGSGATAAPTGDGKVSQTPAALTVKAEGAAPAPVAVAKSAAPAALPAKTLPPASYDAEMKICGEAYKVHFQETIKGGETMTEVTAHRASSSDSLGDATAIFRAPLAQTTYEKESAQRILTTHVKVAREKLKLACNEPATAQSADIAKDAETKTEADEEKKALADGIKNCTKDSRGKSLDKESKIDCWTAALENVSKRVDKKGSNGKRLSEEALSKAILADLQNSQKELKRLLKGELLSDDDSRVEHARDAIETAMSTIEDQADAYDLKSLKSGRKNTSISKMVDQLAALRKGSEVKEEAEKYGDRAKDIRDQSRLARLQMESDRQALLRNPLDQNLGLQYAQSRQDYALVIADYEGLRQEIGMNFEPLQLTPFKKFQSQGMIDRSDFTEFTKSFTDIQKLMKETIGGLSNSRDTAAGSSSRTFSGPITGSVLDRNLDIPTDLASRRNVGPTYRSGTATGVPTVNLPALPSTWGSTVNSVGTTAVPNNLNGRRW
jgi:hypothetical protein